MNENGTNVTVPTNDNGKKIINLKWDDNNQKMTETLVYFSGSDGKMSRKVTETYSLSDNGQTLTLIKAYDDLIGETSFSAKANYKRQ